MKITDHINFALDARVSSDKQDDISNQGKVYVGRFLGVLR
jgi:hypothetical protein